MSEAFGRGSAELADEVVHDAAELVAFANLKYGAEGRGVFGWNVVTEQKHAGREGWTEGRVNRGQPFSMVNHAKPPSGNPKADP